MKLPYPVVPFALVLATGLSSCGGSDDNAVDPVNNVQNIVVIYGENRSFDNLYGDFPGAHGLGEVVDASGKPTSAYVPQKDRDGSTVLATLPATWGGVTAAGATPVVTQAQSLGLANAPFSIETAFTASSGVTLDANTVTRDLYHRFFENQMQVNGGKNDMYAAWADAGGLTMGHYTTAKSALYALAQQYTLADNFFQGAWGGSFLNHQYLICACAPEYPNADTAAAKPTIAALDKDAAGNFVPRLTVAAGSPPSAADGAAKFVLSGNIAPLNYFGDNKFYAVNTMQAAFEPSGNPPAAAASGPGLLYADTTKATTLPAQSAINIGDLLTAKGVGWKWYAGAWNAALTDGTQASTVTRATIYTPSVPRGSPDFQPHHQPFNYYAAFDPESFPIQV